jgi:hypothetical protein
MIFISKDSQFLKKKKVEMKKLHEMFCMTYDIRYNHQCLIFVYL